LRCALLALDLSLFFFVAPATSVIYSLSLHDALPICAVAETAVLIVVQQDQSFWSGRDQVQPTVIVEIKEHGVEHIPGTKGLVLLDRKSTRLNSSHDQISYAVFCLKKKKKKK